MQLKKYERLIATSAFGWCLAFSSFASDQQLHTAGEDEHPTRPVIALYRALQTFEAHLEEAEGVVTKLAPDVDIVEESLEDSLIISQGVLNFQKYLFVLQQDQSALEVLRKRIKKLIFCDSPMTPLLTKSNYQNIQNFEDTFEEFNPPFIHELRRQDWRYFDVSPYYSVKESLRGLQCRVRGLLQELHLTELLD